ncbi:amidohydrolase family protein [Aerococcaceae bacterium zg-252]|uniref:amidohydrolase family protein n=2 Tax=Lactobacillales TaxID=186826 RepID=UPI0013BC5EA8|nr:amidohydrolase family protein [Facklamia sp. 253]NEW64618.1 amidohydrolase family protein [Facklamia sp. 252]NEW67943.1 amidohydrolase family protein [Facklamia sp. 253]
MMKIYDIHVHVADEEGYKINGQDVISASEMVDSMNERGIKCSVLMSQSEIDNELGSNKMNREIIKRYPERFKYMCFIKLEDMNSIEERLLNEKRLGAIGVGELTENKPIDSAEYFTLFKAAEKLQLPILFHISTQLPTYYGVFDEEKLPGVEKVLKEFPQLIVIGHSQAFWYEMDEHSFNSTPEERNGYPKGSIIKEGRVQELLRKYPNLYCDLSANSGGNAIMRDKEYGIKFIEEFQDRLFFGTDIYSKELHFPLLDYLHELVVENNLAPKVVDKILFENFEHIFCSEAKH